MTRIDRFRAAGLFDASAPRYTSYPPANHFGTLAAETYEEWLRALPPAPISLYVHIPFCERLCWFCACRTQAVNSTAPVDAYLEVLRAEVDHVVATLPPGVTVGRLHWGGGTPTILSAEQIAMLAGVLRAALPFEPNAEFSVEAPIANSSQLVLPMMTASASRRRSMTVAS